MYSNASEIGWTVEVDGISYKLAFTTGTERFEKSGEEKRQHEVHEAGFMTSTDDRGDIYAEGRGCDVSESVLACTIILMCMKYRGRRVSSTEINIIY